MKTRTPAEFLVIQLLHLEPLLSEPPDYQTMNPKELRAEGRRLYTSLQRIWAAELRLPAPDWRILESASCQMRDLENGCPEISETA